MSIRADIPVSPEIAEGLGRVIIAFGMLEKELLAAIAFLLSTHEQLARAAMASLGFGVRVDVLVAVAWARWQDDAPIESIKETAKRLRAVAKRRNDYVHSLLLGTATAEPPYTPGSMASYFGSQRGRQASIQIIGLLTRAQLGEAVVEIEGATRELVRLHAELEDVARWYGDFVDIKPEWVRSR